MAGRVAVITGGARGLGLAIARQLAARRMTVVLISRSAEELTRAVTELRSRGCTASAQVCDVRDEGAIKDAVAAVVREHGRLDLLVNAAGVIAVGPFAHTTDDDFKASLDSHFWGPLFAIRAALPALAAHQGRIVNVSSIGGRIAVPHLLPYCVGKFALSALSDGLHAELGPAGISVLTVTPGLMRTGSYRNVSVRGRHRAEASWFAVSSATPLTAVDVSTAAARIVRAAIRRQARLTIGLQARTAELASVIAPELTAELSRLANSWLMPRPSPGHGAIARASRDIDLGWLAGWLPTTLATHMNQPLAADERRHATRGSVRRPGVAGGGLFFT